jgi:hypothetical protein
MELGKEMQNKSKESLFNLNQELSESAKVSLKVKMFDLSPFYSNIVYNLNTQIVYEYRYFDKI